ncbi:helix-turn-helix domain-containing protein [Polaromonas sp. LjRoot131]|uniref:helix-turn-helix domain-containing protein n=1 Tax=Polaromonas sp. LjRoot131 TaxID=3342262 RepID=UPI003ECCA5A8
MSELDLTPAGQSEGEAAPAGFSHSGMPAPGATAGGLLRQAREAAGIHIAALAVSLKVPVKKLEALEQDRFDLLPDAVFVRALASSVCRTLKLDAAPVLGLLPQTSAPKLTYQGTGINAPFRSPGEGPGPSIWTQVSRPAVLAGLLLLLGALVLIFLPAIKHDGSNGKTETADTTMPPGADAGKPLPVAIAGPGGLTDMSKPAVPAEQASAPPAAASAAAPTTVPLSIATLPPAVLSPTPPAAVAASAPAVAPPAAPVPVAAASQAMPAGIVTFRAKGESWVEVTDAKGTVVLRRTLTAGEVAGASGVLPLAAVVGKADLTQVQVRGQAFDLTAVARDNVARFEVK